VNHPNLFETQSHLSLLVHWKFVMRVKKAKK